MQVETVPPSTRRILLVDDEPLVRSGTALMLDELGHAVVEASSGQQGLDALLQDDSIDLLITDFRMPDMDGLQVIAESRKQVPGLKAILMTGYDAEDPRFAGLDAVNLAKPFGLDDLDAAIMQAIKGD